MKSKIKHLIIFLAGAVTGAGGMFAFIKAKWQKDFDAKREEMIGYYENKKSEPKTKETDKTVTKEETEKVNSEDVKKANDIIKRFDYSKISESPERTKNLSPALNDDYREDPYEIDGREYGSNEMYEMLTFYLHDDGDIVNDKYEPLDEDSIENYIGTDILKRIANKRDENPELDSYYIRNDRLKLDIEILIEPEG